MHHVLRLMAVLTVALAGVLGTATTASAEGAFVGQGCFLGPNNTIPGIGGVVIAPNEDETAVARCIVVQSDETFFRPQECYVYTAGRGEIIVFMVTANGTVVFICSNARSG